VETEKQKGRVRKVVIAGGGTAGWVAACALTHQFRGLIDITLVESEQIATVGVGESTIPTIRTFHRLLQIDEREFMSAAAATFKLSISFENWRVKDERFFHPFGSTGLGPWACEFHHFWMDGLRRGMKSELGDYCLETLASREDKFFINGPGRGPQQWSTRWVGVSMPGEAPEVSYAYHFDAALYAAYMRRKCEGYGLTRIEGKIRQVLQDPESGYVTALVLEDGTEVEGDLFLDCTGTRSVLIEQTLKTGFEDWGHWLRCNRAVALQAESTAPPVPYTRAIAHEAGWRWQIPLQHRIGAGLVYCSDHMSDDEAMDKLLKQVNAPTIRSPWQVPFSTGRRLKAWNKNVISLGLASGFIEPLESTSIHLTLSSVARLLTLFPTDGITPALVDRYNQVSREEMEHIRDFIILHYHLNERDEPFWRGCREMDLPDKLAARIAQFRQRGHAWQGEDELFRLDSWTHCMLGQGVVPEQHHILPQAMSDADLQKLFEHIRRPLVQAVARMPSHQDFLNSYCRAPDSVWNLRGRSTVG
jgi:tryptophan halogenase